MKISVFSTNKLKVKEATHKASLGPFIRSLFIICEHSIKSTFPVFLFFPSWFMLTALIVVVLLGWPNMHESEISLGTSDFPIILT